MKKTVYLILLSILTFSFSQGVAQCNAGNDTAINICINDAPVDLFGHIGGAPITGGSWLDPANAPFVNPLDPMTGVGGVYKYIVTSDLAGNACVVNDTAFIAVTIVAIPVVTFDMDDMEGCGELDVQFTNTTAAPGYTTCSWNFGDGSTSSVCNPIHDFSTVGCFDVTLTVSNGVGCMATRTVASAACVLEAPTAHFVLENNPIFTNEPLAVFEDQSEGAASYEYIIAGVGNYTEKSPVIEFPAIEGTYFTCLEVTGVNGCQDSYCSNVLVRNDVLIFVPSAFSPNEDHVNDTFKPTLTFAPQKYEMIIFDRWGTEVFRSDSPSLGWNGATLDSQFFAEDGYYSYRIKATNNGSVIEQVGQVTLLR